MRIVYLPAARDDLTWLRRYYTRIFPDGARRAFSNLLAAESMLSEHPAIGRATEYPGVRELLIRGTPFSIIYRVTADEIRILRIWDGRADRRHLDPDP